jgi:ATP-dependent helicase/nuclease subunit A
MESADRRLHEVPYSLPLDGGVESGIIDALYLQEGQWTIVEFKTDRVTDDVEFDQLLSEEDYLAQARRYVAAVESLLGEHPRCLLCMLNYGERVELYRPDL